MGVLATLKVKVVGDISDFDKKMSSVKDKANNVAGSMMKVGGVMTAGVTAPAIAAGIAVVNAASDMEESLSKVNVVFGDSADGIVDWSKTSAKALGISQEEALAAAGTYGNLFTSMEIGAPVAADMSQDLVGLAADLASFNNIDPTVALEKLRAGLTGETEPLKSLGVNLNAAQIQMKAFEMGLVDMTHSSTAILETTMKASEATEVWNAAVEKSGAHSDEAVKAQIAMEKSMVAYNKAIEGSPEPLTAAAKAQASLALIMEQTTTAQGDFARTSDGLANKQRIVTAQVKDAAVQMGTFLLPIALQLVNKIQELVTWFTNLDPSIMQTIVQVVAVAAAIGPLLLGVGFLIKAVLGVVGAFQAAGVAMATAGIALGPLLLIIGLIVGAIVLLALAWKNNWGGIQEKTFAAIEFIKGLISQFLANIMAWWEEHKVEIMATVAAIWEGIQKVIDTVIKIIQTVVGFFLDTIARFWKENGADIMFIVKTAFNTVKKIITTVLNVIKRVVGAVLSAIQSFWAKNGAQILASAKRIWGFIKTVITLVMRVISSIIKAVSSAIKGDWSAFGEHLRTAWDTAWKLITTILNKAWDTIKGIVSSLITNVISFFTETDWGAVGKSIIEGIAKGITGAVGFIKDAAKNAARAALKAAKSFLGIGSPSKEFMKLGFASAEGYAIGFNRDSKRYLNALPQNLSPSAVGRGDTNITYNVTGSFQSEPEGRITDTLKLMSSLYG